MFLVIQSILVYGLMIWVMTYFGGIAYKKQYPQGIGRVDMYQNRKVSFSSLVTKSYYLIPIFVFCFFAAVRFRVGTDCESYKFIFYELGQFGTSLRAPDIELGFKYIAKFVYSITATHYLFLFILAFLQISFLYYAQRKSTYSLKFFGLVLILCGTYLSLMNGIRQNIVACIFVAIIPLILDKKKWILYIFAVYLASLMHKSAYILYPIGILAYFCQYRIPNRYIQLVCIAVCFVLMDKIQITNLSNYISIYGADAGYSDSAIETYSNVESYSKAFGLRSMLLLASYIITVLYSQRMAKFFNSKIFNIQYNLFLIGVCLFMLFYNDYLIGRILFYLRIFIPIMISSCMFYLWESQAKSDKTVFKILLFFLLVHFTYELYSSFNDIQQEIMLYKFDF